MQKEGQCPTCGNIFVFPRHNPDKIYCSAKCYHRRKINAPKEDKLNASETLFRDRFKEETTQLFHTGFPDFLIEKNGELIFVEVKTEVDNILRRQIQVMDLLTKHGIRCFISFNGSNDLIPFEALRPHFDLCYSKQKIAPAVSKLLAEKNHVYNDKHHIITSA